MGYLNFLASCSLWQFQVKFKVTKFMTGNRRIPSKIVCPSHVWIERSFIIEAEEKTYCSSFSVVWWYGYRGYRDFSKQPTWRYWSKKSLILTSWGTGKKVMLIDRIYLTCYQTTHKKLIGRFQNRISIIFLSN